ncbi:MAG: YhdP family protein [bacterium]|nr:TIGR02099 family protein [Gammaproteobacteria bacterium]HIL98663.1 TIGR02099 family protein [Pseudomonadales bacterium]
MIARTAKKLIVKTFQALLLGILVLAAVYVSIGRILIVTIDGYKSVFAEIITGAINLPVSIGTLEGTWTYLDPKFVVQDLVIGTKDEPAIELDHVVLVLDTIASFVELTPVIREVEIEGLKLALLRDDAGSWSIRGLPKSGKPFDPEPLLESIAYLTFVRLRDVEFEVFGRRGHYKVTSYKDRPFQLSLTENIRTLSWPLYLSYLDNPETAKTHFQFSGMYRGDPRSDDFWSEFYLKLPLLELTEFLPPVVFGDYRLKHMEISGEVWLTAQGSDVEIRGLPIIDKVTIESSLGEVDVLRNLNIKFVARGDVRQGGMVLLPTVNGIVGDENWQLKDVRISFESGGNELVVATSIPLLDVGKIAATVLNLGQQFQVLDESTATAVDAVNPTGVIENVFFLGQFGDDSPDLKLTATIDDVKIDRYKGSPAISKLDGFVLLTPGGGFLDIHNDAPFNMTFPVLFSAPWHFDSAHTRIHYSYEPQNLKIHSELIVATSGETTANAKMFFNLPPQELDHNWGLELGVRNTQLLNSSIYIPTTLPDELVNWISQAVIGGFATESGMVFHGSLNGKAPKEQKAFEIYFKVEDTILDYDPLWPRLDDLEGTIYVGNREVYVDNARAAVFDSRVTRAEIRIPINPTGLVDTIEVDGSLEGPFSDGLRLLTETPLFESTNKMANGWIGSGVMRGIATLNIPIGLRAKEVPVVRAKVSLEQSAVYIPQFDLRVEDLEGDFTYDTHRGINSEGFTAQLFEQLVDGEILTDGGLDSGVIDVDITGPVDVKALQIWSDQLLLTRANGIAGYHATLHIPYGQMAKDPIFIEVESDLDGVAIDLPQPMGKVSEESVSFRYQQTFLDTGFRIELNLDNKTRGVLKVIDDSIVGGRIHYGKKPMGAVTFDQLKVTGEIDKLVYGDWELISEDLGEKSDASLEDELAETLGSIELRVGLLDTYGFELEDVQTYVTRNQDVWAVGLQNDMLTGTIMIPDIDELPMTVQLDVMRFDSNDYQGNEDPMWDVDPAELTAVDFRVEKLFLDDEDYGSWSFDYRPDPSGSVLQNLTAEVKGLQLVEGSSAHWVLNDGKHQSSFSGEIQVADLGFTMEQWGYASSVEGEDFTFLSDVSWSGSPAMIELETIVGTVEIAKGNGRFVQAESNVGALKLLGILDFASLSRRLQGDFSDVVDSGFSFDEIEGSARFNTGIIDILDPIVIKGASSTFKVGGRVDLGARTLDNELIVTLPVSRNLPWYAAYSAFAVSPLTGAGVFLAQKLFQNQIDALSSAKYRITGSIDEPVIEFDSMFNDTVRASPDEPESPPGD